MQKQTRSMPLVQLSVLVATALISGCYHIPPVKALDVAGNISPNVAALTNSSQGEFWSYTAVHGGDGIIIKQEGGASIEAGTHSYYVLVTRRSKLGIVILQDVFYRDAVCGFVLDAKPGHVYTLGTVQDTDQGSTDKHMVHRAKISIVENDNSHNSTEYLLNAECASAKYLKGSFVPPSSWWNFQLDNLCRQDDSCSRDREVCRRDPGFQFGVCITQSVTSGTEPN